MKWYHWLLLIAGAGGAGYLGYRLLKAPATPAGSPTADPVAAQREAARAQQERAQRGIDSTRKGTGIDLFGQGGVGSAAGTSMLGGVWDSWKSSLGF